MKPKVYTTEQIELFTLHTSLFTSLIIISKIGNRWHSIDLYKISFKRPLPGRITEIIESDMTDENLLQTMERLAENIFLQQGYAI